jgi:hypothetical protein
MSFEITRIVRVIKESSESHQIYNILAKSRKLPKARLAVDMGTVGICKKAVIARENHT